MPLEKLTAGWETTTVSDLRDHLEEARKAKFDFVVIPLVHPRFERDSVGVSETRQGTLTRSDMEVDSRTWTTCIVGKVSEWLDPCSADAAVRLAGEAALKQELAWASHLAVPAVLLPMPRPDCANYARILNQTVSQATVLQLWVRVPLVCRSAEDEEEDEDEEDENREGEGEGGGETARNTYEKGEPTVAAAATTAGVTATGTTASLPAAAATGKPQRQSKTSTSSTTTKTTTKEDPWETWNRLRTLCEYNASLGVALEMTEDLPTRTEVLQRWGGEPVKALIFPTSIFLTNKKGYPVLSKAHQAFVLEMYQFKIQVLVKGRARHPGGFEIYLQYLEHLRLKLFPMPEQDRFESPYYDYLQAPLQPLMDNLESQTVSVCVCGCVYIYM